MNKKFEGLTELTERPEEEGRTEGEGSAVGALCRTPGAARLAGRSAATWVARWQEGLGGSSDRGMTTSEYSSKSYASFTIDHVKENTHHARQLERTTRIRLSAHQR